MTLLGPTDLVVIDDDADLRMLVTYTFRLHGWSVNVAADGASGLDLLHDLVRSGSAPAVLLDVQMSGLDGWDVLRQIRADPELAPLAVQMCTVLSSETDRLRGYALGADGFIAKPFDSDELVYQVQELNALSPRDRAALRDTRSLV